MNSMQPGQREEIGAAEARNEPEASRLGLLDRIPAFLGRNKTLKYALLTLFAFSPAIICGYHVATNAVNIPTWDDWERGDLLQHYYEGTLGFKYLYSPHIDHRILFPRLIILALNELTGGDLRVEILVSYGIVVAGGIALFMLILRTLERRDSAYVVTFLVNLFLFAPLQYQNFLWAIQIAFVLPLACLAIILLAMTSRLRLWAKFLITLAATTVATHSFAHGLVLWPVALCLPIFLKEFAPLKRRLTFIGLFLLCAIAIITPYFAWDLQTTSHHGYGYGPGERPPGIRHLAESPEHLDKVFRYALALLGNTMARLFHSDPMEVARDTGRTVLILFLCGVGWMFLKRKTEDWNRLLPWAAAGFYSIAVAVIIGLGRYHIGENRALLTRYVSNTMYIYIALVVMAALILYRWQEKSRDARTRESRFRLTMGMAIACAMLHLPQWVYGVHKMEAWRLARLQERVAVLYFNHFVPPHRYLGRIDHVFDFPFQYANYLNSKGLMTPALFERLDFGSFEIVSRPLPPEWARFSGAQLRDSRSVRVDGYATLDGAQDIAHGVLLTYRKAGDAWKVFAMVNMKPVPTMRAMFLDSHFGEETDFSRIELYARWTETVSLEDLPEGRVEIGAWALDAEQMRAYPMTGKLSLDRSSDQPEMNFTP